MTMVFQYVKHALLNFPGQRQVLQPVVHILKYPMILVILSIDNDLSTTTIVGLVIMSIWHVNDFFKNYGKTFPENSVRTRTILVSSRKVF
jgi:hypothetical protein